MILSSKYCFFAAHYTSNWPEINAQSNRHLNASVLRVIQFQGVTFFVLTFFCWEPCSHQNNTRTCPRKIITSSVQWINRKWIELYSTNVVVLTFSYTTRKKKKKAVTLVEDQVRSYFLEGKDLLWSNWKFPWQYYDLLRRSMTMNDRGRGILNSIIKKS